MTHFLQNIYFYLTLIGEILAKDLDCSFAEVAASEQVTQLAEVFHEVSKSTKKKSCMWRIKVCVYVSYHYYSTLNSTLSLCREKYCF
jgi:hypothetical protein